MIGRASRLARCEPWRSHRPPFLLKVQEEAEAAIAAGLSLEDFIAARPFAAYDAEWGAAYVSPEDFMTTIYQRLIYLQQQ